MAGPSGPVDDDDEDDDEEEESHFSEGQLIPSSFQSVSDESDISEEIFEQEGGRCQDYKLIMCHSILAFCMFLMVWFDWHSCSVQEMREIG